MDPSQRFEWCIRALKLNFRMIAQDIFTRNGTFTTGLSAVLLILTSLAAALILTIVKFEAILAFTAAVTLFGVFQVSTYLWLFIKP